jgi:hypothetical protein
MPRLMPKERQIQMAVIDFIRLQYPWLIEHTIYIMNEKKCSEHLGHLLNRMGRLKGASDLFIAWPTCEHYGLFLELKRPDGKPTKSQVEFSERMNKIGYLATIAYSIEEAIAVIKDYLH